MRRDALFVEVESRKRRVACRAQAEQAEPAVVVTTYNILGGTFAKEEEVEEEEEGEE